MAKMRKVKRSIATAILVWIGRRLLGRVQKQTMKSIARKPTASKSTASSSRLARFCRATPAPVVSPARRRKTAKGIGFAILSTAAVAALKVGVEHIVESEREQHVVTPDFDVFADDDE